MIKLTVVPMVLALTAAAAVIWGWRKYGNKLFSTKLSKSQQRLHRQIYQRMAPYPWLAWLLQWSPMGNAHRRRWLLVIGVQASGKTELIEQAFSPVNHSQTPWAKVFYNQQIVSIEMDAQVYNQKPACQHWHYLLGLVRRYRYRKPFDAILLTIALPEVLTSSASQWDKHIERYQRQLLDIQQKLSTRTPVYFVFTKLDLLKHFTEFAPPSRVTNRLGFDMVDSESEHSPLAFIHHRLTGLYHSLELSRMDKWQKAAELNAQLAIYDFPQQFNRCQIRLQAWFTKWFAKSLSLPLAGVYFSACPSVNSTVDQPLISRPMADDAAEFITMNRQSKSDATGDKILPAILIEQANITVMSGWSGQLQRLWPHYTLAAASVLFCWLMIHLAWQNSKTFLFALHKTMVSIQSADASMVSDSLLQQSIHNHQYLIEQRQQRRRYYYLGLRHTKKIEKALISRIIELLQFGVLQNLPAKLIARLAQYQSQWSALADEQKVMQYPDYYNYFKFYTQLGQMTKPKINHKPLLRYLIGQQLNENIHWDDKVLDYIVDHYPLHVFTTVPIDYPLLQRVRMDLQDMRMHPHANYQRLIHDLTHLRPELRIDNDRLTLPLLATAKGWRQLIKPAMVDQLNDQLLAPLSPMQQQTLSQQITMLHARSLNQQWLQWFEHRLFARLPIIEQPLLAWLTTWLAPSGTMTSVVQHVHQQWIAIEKLAKRSKKSLDYQFAKIAEQELMTWASLSKQLSRARQWQTQYTETLQPLMAVLHELAASDNPEHLALQTLQQWQTQANNHLWRQTRQQLVQSSQLLLDTDAQQLWQRWLTIPADHMWQLITRRAKQYINQQWKAQVYDDYQQAIANQFPFTAANSKSSSMVELKSLTHWLQPDNGLLWQFTQSYYSPFKEELDFDADWQRYMQYARHLSELLFSGATDALTMTIALQPVPNPQLQELRFTHGRQTLRYQNEPQQWMSFTWPLPEVPFVTTLGVRLINDHWITVWEFEGTWSLFQLLVQAKLTQLDETTLRADWRIHRQGTKSITASMLLRTTANARVLLTLLTGTVRPPPQVFNGSSL
jgi:type VI protein secretion system component VasK